MTRAVLPRVCVLVVAVATIAWLGVSLRAAQLIDDGESIAVRFDEQLTDDEVQSAISSFESARSLTPDTRPEVFEAGLLIRTGEPRRALALLRDVVAREPDNVTAWGLIATSAGEIDPGLAARARRETRRLRPPVPLPG